MSVSFPSDAARRRLNRLWRRAVPVVQLTVVAWLFDLALAFRVSYMGSTDDATAQVAVQEYWPLILALQGRILLYLAAIAVLLWIWARWGLRLGRRAAWTAAAAYWLMLTLRHARTWPAPYADIRDIRLVPDALFVSVVEGTTGFGAMAVLAALVLALVAWRLRWEQTVVRDWDRPARPTGRPATRWLPPVVGLSVRRGLSLIAAGVWFWWLGALPEQPAWQRQPLADPLRPDVLVLMSDSWRADYFECRADSALTPHLGALCAEYAARGRGGQFAPAYPVQNRTFGSVAAMYTGLPPHESGVHHMFPLRESRDLRDVSRVRGWQDDGYRALVASSFAGDFFKRVDLGFDQIVAPRFGFPVVLAEFCLRAHPLLLPWMATNALGRWIEPYFTNFADLGDSELEAQMATWMAQLAPADEPLFLTAFLSATHSPYAGREGASWRRGDDPVVARYRWYPLPYEAGRVDAELVPAIRHRYADAVQHVDRALGQLAAEALATDNTIVVVTSDHGEALYETGTGSHGDHVYGNAQLEVPLLVFDGRTGAPPVRTVAVTAEAAPTGASEATLYSLMDVLPAVRRAATTGTAIELPRHRVLFAESGLIFQPFDPELLEGRRLPYPEILGVLELDAELGEIIVQRPWAETVELGKFRTLITPDWSFVYSPGPAEPRMTLLPRTVIDDALPRASRHAEHPDWIAAAWDRMIDHWGAHLVRRHAPDAACLARQPQQAAACWSD